MTNYNDLYYQTLLAESQRLVQEAHDMLVERDATVARLMDLLREASEDIERLENALMGEKKDQVEH